MNRPPFATRKIRLVGPQQRDLLIALAQNLPLDPDHPLEARIGEETKARTLTQNAAMWSGPLMDIAVQAWVKVDGVSRQFSSEVWHEYFKREYLPDETDISVDELSELVKNPETYRKWDLTPTGDRVLVGSTTQLTVKGFARYMNQLEACGASLGVQFSARAAA